MQGMGGGNFEPPVLPSVTTFLRFLFFFFNCGLILKEVIRHEISEKDL